MSIDFSTEHIADKVFDNFKKVTPALFAMSLVCGLILFLPTSVLEKMSLHHLPDVWKMVIGIIFILCVSLIVTIFAFSFFSNFHARRIAKRFKAIQRKKLLQLSPNQKNIILALLRSEDKAIKLEQNSGDTIYLLTNLFIHQPTQAFSLGWDNEIYLTYVPETWLLDLYNEEPELFNSL